MSKSNGAAPTDTVAKEVLANGKAKSDWETATELTSRKQYWHFDCYPTQINVFYIYFKESNDWPVLNVTLKVAS